MGSSGRSRMTADPPDLRGEFVDDFYTECDELLGNIRAQLTQLDAACGAARTDPVALEALYRHMHSLKGIAAMVGLREAEQLAHAAEGLLRLLSRGETSLSCNHLDLLAAVTRRLEQIVTAHRLHEPLPTGLDLITQLNQFDIGVQEIATPYAARAGSPSADSEYAAASSDRAAMVSTTGDFAASGHVVWSASFSPSSELDQRGININTVRARLAGLGPIISATPLIQSGGRMSFEFTLSLRDAPADLNAWELDGIFLRPVEPKPASSPMPETTRGEAAPSSMFVAPSHIVRVDLSRLDELMRLVGEMVIHRSRLDERILRAGGEGGELQEVNLALGRSLRELREAITRVRLVPIAEVFSRLPFVVRDLARETEKKVRIVIEGQETEIDKYVV